MSNVKAKGFLKRHHLDLTFWGRKIIAAEQDGEFNEDDRAKAEDWTTCACGQQDDVIWRNNAGAPSDPVLERLGTDFFEHITGNRFYMAASALAKIEIIVPLVLEDQQHINRPTD